jgi:hypothetical protein
VRPRRQPDREGRTNVETLKSVVIFPGIGKHASKQHKHDGNRDQVSRGEYEGEIRGVVYANHFGSQRADGAVGESLEAPLVSVNASAKQQHIKILAQGRWQQPKMNDHRINRKRRQHRGQYHTHGVPLARQGVDSLGYSAHSHFGYLLFRWRGGSSRTSNRLISLDQLRVAICIQQTGSARRAIVWSKPHIIPAAIAGGNYPSNQLPTLGRSPFNAASEPSPKPHYPTLARLHPGC